MILGVAAALAAPVLVTGVGSPPEASLDRLTVEEFAPTDDGAWLSAEVPVTDVVLVGATIGTDATVEVRAHDGDGWGPWLAFPEVHDHGPDDHSSHGHHGHHGHHGRDHARAADAQTVPHRDHHTHARHWGRPTPGAHPHRDVAHDRRWGQVPDPGGAGSMGIDLDPLWVGPSERLQVRVQGERPRQLALDTVAMPPDQMLANQPVPPGPGAAHAATGDPLIIPRDAWDPDGECRPTDPPESGEVRMAHIHHTVMYPTYTPEEADDVVRALCLFHVEARGFDDLGYNFMVDAYGRVYEGRAGGIDRAVVGSHAAGFNHVSAGISVMGDHETDPVSDETVRAIEGLLAWLFTTHGVDPLGTVVVESTGGAVPGLTPYEEGEEVELPTIVGHRDTGTNTLCPGVHLYEALVDVPPRVADRVLAAAQRVDTDDEPADEGPGSTAGGGGVIDAAAPAPALPVTGWGGLALGLITLGIPALLADRRARRRVTEREDTPREPRERDLRPNSA